MSYLAASAFGGREYGVSGMCHDYTRRVITVMDRKYTYIFILNMNHVILNRWTERVRAPDSARDGLRKRFR